MSKELEALERLVDDVLDIRHYYKQFSSSTPIIMQDKQLIENALERLIELEDIFREIESGEAVVVSAEKNKALEIINKKEINVALLKNPCVSLKEYNVIIKDQIGKPFRLTQEEYDLLKEVLL